METLATMSYLRYPRRLSISHSSSKARCFHLLSFSVPLFGKQFKTPQPIHRQSTNIPLLIVRSCSRITSKPSPDIQKKPIDLKPDEKLRAIRELFSKPGIAVDAYIIPSQDAHQSEFIAECFMRRAHISGFTGSAGTAVVTKDKAALWTDGRYFLQAEKQLSPSWMLMRAGNYGVPTTFEWLNDVLAPGGRVGIDPFLFSSDAAEELKGEISKKNHELVYLHNINLVDEIWKESRPKLPSKPVRLHDLKYAGVDVSSKLSSLRSELIQAGSSAIVISMLDEVAWLLNLVEHVIREQNIMAANEMIELFCELVVARLSIIAKQRECEGISSLIFSAPRCADIPQLLQIRTIFEKKYGKEFVNAATELRHDCGVNRMLIDKLSVRTPTGEVELKLMKEIAKEYQIAWDHTETENELLKPPIILDFS